MGAQVKGTLHLSLRAVLTEIFLSKVEGKKKEYLSDNRAKLDYVNSNLDQKYLIIS